MEMRAGTCDSSGEEVQKRDYRALLCNNTGLAESYTCTNIQGRRSRKEGNRKGKKKNRKRGRV